MRRALLAALLVAASGCLVPAPSGGPHVPRAPAEAWSGWEGAWVTQSDGCGMCGGSLAQGAEMFLTAVDRRGSVVRVDYAVGGSGGVALQDPALEAWRPVVAPLFAAREEYGQQWEDGRVRVFAVHAAALAASDAEAVREVLEAAVARVHPLPPPDFSDCADCGAPVLHAGGLRAETDRHTPEASGWPALSRQMSLLRAWVAGEPVLAS